MPYSEYHELLIPKDSKSKKIEILWTERDPWTWSTKPGFQYYENGVLMPRWVQAQEQDIEPGYECCPGTWRKVCACWNHIIRRVLFGIVAALAMFAIMTHTLYSVIYIPPRIGPRTLEELNLTTSLVPPYTIHN